MLESRGLLADVLHFLAILAMQALLVQQLGGEKSRQNPFSAILRLNFFLMPLSFGLYFFSHYH